MNNQNPNNPTPPPADFNIDDSVNYGKHSEEILNELLDLPYAEILKKHPKEEFFSEVFDRAVDGDVALLGSLIADDFIPENNQKSVVPKKLTPTQNEAIIEILAEDQTQNPTEILKQIQAVLPEAVLPKDFDYNDYHNRSIKVYNATLSIKAVIAEFDAYNYQNDLRFFLKLTPAQIETILKDEGDISVTLQKEYDNLLTKGTLPNPKTLDASINFLKEIGRSAVQINSLKEKKNLGVISEIIVRAERSMKIALDIKKKNITVATEEELLGAIANYLVENIHL